VSNEVVDLDVERPTRQRPLTETEYDRIKQAIIRCDLELSNMFHDRNEDGYQERHEVVDALIAGDGARAERVMAAQAPATRAAVGLAGRHRHYCLHRRPR
jgi:hypothetical protein